MNGKKGRFGRFGGQYVPETLMNALIDTENAYQRYKDDADFKAELQRLSSGYARARPCCTTPGT